MISMAQGIYIAADFILVLGLTSTVGALVAILVLWISFVQRTMIFWPIAIQPSTSGLIVRLAERRKWCCLDALSPTLAVRALQFKPPPRGYKFMLPEELKSPRFGTWLKLTHTNRMRWVLLGHFGTEDESLEAALDWSAKLDLPENSTLDHQQPPECLVYYFNPKVL
ncbi:MAG: hypothetical protein JKY96_01530 [Phycisphaerales bacterium]|nr:hypothetical protein [Phycisphaerales bacterium]